MLVEEDGGENVKNLRAGIRGKEHEGNCRGGAGGWGVCHMQLLARGAAA